MIDPGNAVREVWAARDRIWDEIKDMTPEEQVKHIHRKGSRLAKKYGLKYYSPVEKTVRRKARLKKTSV